MAGMKSLGNPINSSFVSGSNTVIKEKIFKLFLYFV